MSAMSSLRCLSALLVGFGVAHAQVRVEWERVHTASSNPYLSADRAVSVPIGDYYVAGREYVHNAHVPGYHYLPGKPFLLRLDAQGDLVWALTRTIPAGVLQPPVVLACGAADQAYLGFEGNGAELVRFEPDGTQAWASPVPGCLSFREGGLGTTPAGDIVAVVRTNGEGVGVAVFGPAGNLIHFTTPIPTPTATQLYAAIDASGRAAGHSLDLVFVVRPDGSPDWTAPLDFSVRSLQFGPSGELAVAGWDGNGDPIVRLYDVAGAVAWTRVVLHPSTNAAWTDVEFDAWGGVALAGTASNGPIDSRDGILALYAPNGALQWQNTVDGPAGFGDAFDRVLVSASGDLVAAGTTYLSSFMPQFGDEWGSFLGAWDRTGNPRWTFVGQRDVTTTLLETASHAIVSAGGRRQYILTTNRPVGAHVLSLRPQSRALCFGDAASAACPCGNASAPGAQEGCTNSTGTGARLVDGGIASLSADTLTLTVEGTTPTAPGLYFSGSPAIAPAVLGDGLRCAGGTLRRLYTRSAVGGTSTVPAPGDPTISQRAAAAGDVLAPGSTRVYQVYHRDLNAAFCPPPQGANSNVSSALAITWGA